MTHAEAATIITFLSAKGFRIAAIVQLLRDKDRRNWYYEKNSQGTYVIRCGMAVVWKDTRHERTVASSSNSAGH